MSRALAAIALSGLFAFSSAPRAASTAYPDYTDLWWNSQQSGWGAQVVLQGDVIFLTLFVYDGQRRPLFLVASDMRPTTPGGATFTGALARTSGPAFAGAFDPSRVTQAAVGTATLRFDSPFAARLTYTADGVTVSESLTRTTWKGASLAGDYKGGLFAAAANCTGGTGANSISYPGSMRVTQVGDSVQIDSSFDPVFAQGGMCRLGGKLTQQGRLAAIAGTYTCEFIEGPTPVAGTFEITGIEFGESGFSGAYVGHEGAACVHTGRYGGVRQGYAQQLITPDPGPPACTPTTPYGC